MAMTWVCECGREFGYLFPSWCPACALCPECCDCADEQDAAEKEEPEEALQAGPRTSARSAQGSATNG